MTEAPEYDPKFRLISIEKIDPPTDNSNEEWYHYVIGQGTSKIDGKRSGTLNSVTQHAEEYIDNLNQRSWLGYSAYATRKVTK